MKNKVTKNNSKTQKQFFSAIAAINSPELAKAFFSDLCTPSEIESMTDRLTVAPLLKKGLSYRNIHAKTGVSLTTIGRVARSMQFGLGGYDRLLEKLEHHN